MGFVANQPQVLAGVLDNDSSKKGARFVRFCDAFNIPIVTFVDVPGFLAPGTKQEYGGLIERRQAVVRLRRSDRTQDHRHHPQGLRRLLRRDELKTHPRRRELRLAHRRDRAVMKAKGAVEIIFRAEAKDPEVLAEREAEYKARFANPFVAAQRGYIDDVIMPHGTRRRIIKALKTLANKKLENPWKKHDNIPL